MGGSSHLRDKSKRGADAGAADDDAPDECDPSRLDALGLAWAARLGICDDALGKFTGLWFSLDAATRSSAPPPKDGTRCSACSRRVGIGRKKRGLNYEKHGGDCDTACSKAVVKVLAAIARDAGESYYGGVNSHKKVAAYKAEARPGEEVDESAPSLRRAADDRGRKYDGKSGTAGDASFVAPVASFEPAVDCTPKCVRVYAQSGERCGRACPGLLASLDYASDEFCSCRCETAELARRDEVLETAREIEAARAKAQEDKPAAAPRRAKKAPTLGSMLASCERKEVSESEDEADGDGDGAPDDDDDDTKTGSEISSRLDDPAYAAAAQEADAELTRLRAEWIRGARAALEGAGGAGATVDALSKAFKKRMRGACRDHHRAKEAWLYVRARLIYKKHKVVAVKDDGNVVRRAAAHAQRQLALSLQTASHPGRQAAPAPPARQAAPPRRAPRPAAAPAWAPPATRGAALAASRVRGAGPSAAEVAAREEAILQMVLAESKKEFAADYAARRAPAPRPPTPPPAAPPPRPSWMDNFDPRDFVDESGGGAPPPAPVVTPPAPVAPPPSAVDAQAEALRQFSAASRGDAAGRRSLQELAESYAAPAAAPPGIGSSRSLGAVGDPAPREPAYGYGEPSRGAPAYDPYDRAPASSSYGAPAPSSYGAPAYDHYDRAPAYDPPAPAYPSYDAPPYAAPAVAAPPADFAGFLRAAGLERYHDLLRQEEIHDVGTLRLLTADDLKDVGLPYGPRIKLLALAKEATA